MPDTFVPYAAWLASLTTSAEPQAPEEPSPPAEAIPERPSVRGAEEDAAVAEARRFRAALREALEAIRGDLLRDLAADVLGRELELAPVDLDAVIERACARYRVDEPLAVRVAPGEGSSVRVCARVIEDAELRSGDVVLDLQCGEIDARLGIRLERLLAAYR